MPDTPRARIGIQRIKPRRRFGHMGLGAKFVLLTVGILAITMAVTAAINYRTQSSLLERHLNTKARMLGRFVALISPEAILSYDFATLNNYMKEITRQDEVVYAVLRSANDAVLSVSIDPTDARVLALGKQSTATIGQTLELVSSLRQANDVVRMEFPIEFQNNHLGKLTIAVSQSEIHTDSQRVLVEQLLQNAAIILVLSFCIYGVFSLNVLRPIRALMQGAERVAGGQLDEPVPQYARDELGTLSHVFNTMMAKLRITIAQKDQAYGELQELNKNLESHVAARTSELEAANKELEYIALHDPLTALPNRALLQDRLEQGVLNAYRNSKPLSVLMLDLDRFKEVNDTLGHNVGDLLLQEVAQRLREQLRGVDTVARLGGDEFAVVLPATDVNGACRVAEKLVRALEPPVTLDDNNISTNASIGIATYPTHGEGSSVLLRCADIAMYVAKRNKSGYAIYSSEDDQHTPSRLTLISDLRQAIERNGLELHYQPKVDVKTGAVVGVEALARWPHPMRGYVRPDEFIPLAEQTGLIRPLTLWVLDHALAEAAALTRDGIALTMAVNLSVRNLQDPSLAVQVRDMLQKHGVPAAQLILEITETAMMSEARDAVEILNGLHALGVKLSIDDFGTGYSSLGRLRKFPIDEIKIDRSFVMDMLAHQDSGVIVHSVIDLAHKLGLQVTGEGVENSEALRLLTRLHCDTVQGFHLSRPLTAPVLREWLRQRGAPTSLTQRRD